MVKLIEEEEFWPCLTSEWDKLIHLRSMFTLFSLSFISGDFNSHADPFVKGVCAKEYVFSHVNNMVPFRSASKTNPFEPV